MANLIKKYRTKAGLTQAALAKHMGYSSPQFISNIERNTTTFPATGYKRLTKIMNVPRKEFLAYKLEAFHARLAKDMGR